MSYWVIKRGDEYLVGGQVFSKDQGQAYRFFARPRNPHQGERVVRVVPRPRPDLAARLAAWEPVVREVEKMRRQWESGLGIYDRVMAVIAASKRVPKEHRP